MLLTLPSGCYHSWMLSLYQRNVERIATGNYERGKLTQESSLFLLHQNCYPKLLKTKQDGRPRHPHASCSLFSFVFPSLLAVRIKWELEVVGCIPCESTNSSDKLHCLLVQCINPCCPAVKMIIVITVTWCSRWGLSALCDSAFMFLRATCTLTMLMNVLIRRGTMKTWQMINVPSSKHSEHWGGKREGQLPTYPPFLLRWGVFLFLSSQTTSHILESKASQSNAFPLYFCLILPFSV